MAAGGPILVSAPHKHTTSPIVTGTSVLGIKYADGVMLAADTLASYGGLSRYEDVRRIRRVGESTLIAASGDYSDFQYIMDLLQELLLEEHVKDDGAKLTAPEIQSYLSRVTYNRRNKQDPLWMRMIVAGVKNGKSELGYVDLYGTTFSDNYIATGFGSHFGLPLIRDRWRADMSEGEARALLEDCMRVLWYRDCRAINRIQLAKMTAAGTVISEPYRLDTKWDFKSFVTPKAGTDTGGSW